MAKKPRGAGNQETTDTVPDAAATPARSRGARRPAAAGADDGAARGAGRARRSVAGTTRGEAGSAASGRGRKTARAGAAAGGGELRGELRRFAQQRPAGWEHDEWLGLLRELGERGHDTSDPDRIGLELERERLALVLEKIPGLGPARIRRLSERFGRLWELRQASVDEIASAGAMPRSLAERVQESVR